MHGKQLGKSSSNPKHFFSFEGWLGFHRNIKDIYTTLEKTEESQSQNNKNNNNNNNNNNNKI